MTEVDVLAGGLGYVAASYAAAALFAVLIIGWVALDYRAQSRKLKELERRGMGRPLS
jgi:heme exporter protein D